MYGPRMVVDSLSRWLCAGELSDPSGHCMSWCNPEHPGYPYPEMSGLLLSLLSREGAGGARSRQLVGALLAPPAMAGVGRYGIGYTFDTAMAARGLLDSRAGDESIDRRVGTWIALLVEAVEASCASVPAEKCGPHTRWSKSFGAHQAKTAAALLAAISHLPLAYVPACPPPRLLAAVQALVDNTMALQCDDGRFMIHGSCSRTYLHAHCYALEGLLMASDGGSVSMAPIEAGVAWLAGVQQADGGFHAWHDGRRTSGPERTDVTAQAVRMFRLLDEHRYAAHIARGTAFLLEAMVPGRGLRYEPGSGDIAAWPTIFAVQALAPEGHPCRPRRAADLV